MKKLKKKKGIIEDVGIPTLAIVVMFIMLMAFISSNSDNNKINQIDSVIRDYSLSMESKGYLDSQSKNDLIKELNDLGVKNVSLTGTTMSKVGYGERIYIVVKGSIEVTSYELDGLFKVNKKTITQNITRSRNTTAKH